ncbi:hypothetical protein [Reichenbachiella ulvae]|uniref:Condensation domain-containing protein n=1 Tax=Reichenbachiella ulvae TaxID=2980104 RepID=A0ABT3CVW4_9BACT|nr:hypothetical protein [Reichenbachiella ulvae]MCV9387828.1 hypothetical protein [Reichenbachiella ulvae]
MRSFPLTGFDTFLLALEKQYNEKAISGNICHYVLDIEGNLDPEETLQKIRSNPYFQVLSRFQHEKAQALHIPKWHYSEGALSIPVALIESSSLIPEEVKNHELSRGQQFLACHLIRRVEDRWSLILSWNHLLMDGYGATLFLKQLFDENVTFDENLLLNYEKPKYNLRTFWRATKSKFFIDYSSRPILTMISPKHLARDSKERCVILSFDEEETKSIDQSALHNGARFGRSAYYLACCTRAVADVLDKRKSVINNFWIPVPRDNRKKGATGPIIGNRLSFLFYRLKKEAMISLKSCVASINEQMMDQIRHKSHLSYNHLMDFMKWLPLGLYYYLVKRRGGNSIASFLFTVAADHPKELDQLFGHPITNAISLPANAYPPGLTFAFMRFHGSLKLMILYHTQALSDEEFQGLEAQLKRELVKGDG